MAKRESARDRIMAERAKVAAELTAYDLEAAKSRTRLSAKLEGLDAAVKAMGNPVKRATSPTRGGSPISARKSLELFTGRKAAAASDDGIAPVALDIDNDCAV